MASRKLLNLPRRLTKETGKVIGNVYEKMGSIEKCKTLNDVGRYRAVLVKEFDKTIRELKHQITLEKQRKVSR